jgi:hypothetical protein
MKMLHRFLPVLVILAGCASTGSSSDKTAAPDRNRITSEEISASHAVNALQLVQQLRPRWLSERGPTSLRTANPVMLYVDDNRVGPASRLTEYSLNDLGELRFLDAISATQRFGIGHRSGAILLYLRRGGTQ